MSGCRNSSFSLQRTKWIVGAIQLETRHTKQRAIQHAFKWNKSQFSPTAEAQRTLNRLCLSTILSVCHLFLLSSDFISSADRLLTYKIVWLQFQGLNIFIDLRIFFLIFVFSIFFPLCKPACFGSPVASRTAWNHQGMCWEMLTRIMTHAAIPVPPLLVDFVYCACMQATSQAFVKTQLQWRPMSLPCGWDIKTVSRWPLPKNWNVG